MDEHTTWTIPGYVAEELIGFGASGEVWRGRSVDSGDAVALKRLREPAAGGGLREPAAGGAARLRREAALLAALDHPHLLGVRAVVEADGTAVLVLDYAAGGSLAMLLRARGRLSPGEVVTVLAPVAAAVAHAHGEGLVHGDVTPANVLFRADGRPLLADLGVARLVGERHDPQSTPEYVDPAVAAGAAPGPASDVFMLAAVALHALTGAPPWSAGSPEEALAQAAAGRLPDLRTLVAAAPEQLVGPLCRALAPRPEDRGTAAELALDLRHGCRPEPVLPVGSGIAGAAAGPGTGQPATRALRVPQRPAPERADARGAGAGWSAAGSRDRVREPAFPAVPGGSGRPGRPAEPARVVRVPPQPAGAGPRHRWQQPPGRRWRRPRVGRLAAVLASLVLLAALAGVGLAFARPSDRPADVLARQPTADPVRAGGREPVRSGPVPAAGRSSTRPLPARPAAGPPRSAAAWRALLDGLDAVRARAYDTGDIALLGRVYRAGAHLSSDAAQLRGIVAAGDRVRGVRHRLRVISIQTQTPAAVRLRVAQALRPSVRLHGGRVVGPVPGTPETVIPIDLVRLGGSWRLA